MIVAVLPRVGGTLSLHVGLDRMDIRNGLDRFVLRQSLEDRLSDPAASAPIDELVVLFRETPAELRVAFEALIGPTTATGEPT